MASLVPAFVAVALSAQQLSDPPAAMKIWMDAIRGDHEIALRNWHPQTNAVVPQTAVRRAKFPIIDVHKHVARPPDPLDPKDVREGVEIMDEVNVRAAVNLTGGWGEALEDNIDKLSEAHPGRFAVCTMINWETIDDPKFSEKAARGIEEAHQAGASCLKISKALGLYVKDRAGKFVAVDDPRLDPVWAKCGELGMPVMIHTADPVAFFRPWDEKNESYMSLLSRPDWYFGGEDYEGTLRFTHEELMRQRNNIVEGHPGTTFVGLHYGSMSHDLAAVAALLDHYPNLMVEMGARNWALGSVPNSGRKFALKYQDRILFGTDGTISAAQFREYIRVLETDDDLITFNRPRPWGPLHGIHLPDEVLAKIYNRNARKLFPSLK